MLGDATFFPTRRTERLLCAIGSTLPLAIEPSGGLSRCCWFVVVSSPLPKSPTEVNRQGSVTEIGRDTLESQPASPPLAYRFLLLRTSVSPCIPTPPPGCLVVAGKNANPFRFATVQVTEKKIS